MDGVSVINSSGESNTIPICREFPDEGSIQLISSVDINKLEGLFSFTLYYRGDSDFRGSIYYYGLFIYAEFIHSMEYFANVGMIIYTDKDSYEKIKQHFSSYPKLIFAIVNWDAYMEEPTKVDNMMMRTLRFQATEAFPNAWIAVRDADTLFTFEIKKIFYNIDSIIVLSKEIGKWEQQFIERFMADDKNICIGINSLYLKPWHFELFLKYAPKFNNIIDTRFKQYRKYRDSKDNPEFLISPPNGVYAGFVNFKTTRQKDIWALCYDFLTTHYTMHNFKNTKIMSNDKLKSYGGPYNAGKDERIIIFAILPKYIDDVRFLTIELQPEQLFRNEFINKKHIYSTELIISPQQTIITILLQDKYIALAYDNKRSDEYVEQFKKFFVEYNAERDRVNSMSNDVLNGHISALLKDKKQNEDYFEPVKRIPRTRRRVGGRRRTRRRRNSLNF